VFWKDVQDLSDCSVFSDAAVKHSNGANTALGGVGGFIADALVFSEGGVAVGSVGGKVTVEGGDGGIGGGVAG
jgi:hypothetical protein